MTKRTINEIYTQIMVEKNLMPTLRNKLLKPDGTTGIDDEQTLLDDLKTSSKVAIYRLWAYITAVIIWFHEAEWYQFKETVEDITSKQYVATAKWLIDKTLEFQDGDDVVIEAPYYYPHYQAVDESKQIISNANIIETAGQIFLKIRRKDTDILSVGETTRLNAYLNKIKVAGQRINVINLNADILKLYYTIYYNALYNINDVKTNVENVITDFIKNVEFDAQLDISALTDSIQTVEGVVAVEYNEGYGRSYGSSTWQQINNYYSSTAGWNIIDTATPLSSTLTYIAKL